ncbi:MAG: Lrp/AsnC family transcriptional regulator [Candidatus Syntrophoarchaeum sp. WYZ-LMO15]|nr:MAG: Lrp/AsnC family transcriptional regulator [Candidatus Syntrophoarchaeum sp. WYZ-LMO15]RLA93452.1 MAG: Lrp/AsnC family transcriptional regulator [Deltaproteobacteria bacterium]
MPLKEFKIDSKDREIITLLIENPEISQKEIAERINLTQPSVAMRLKKLKEMGAIERCCGINPPKLGLHLARVDVVSKDTEGLIKRFRDCPYFLNGFVLSGKKNVCLLFVGEDIPTLEAIVNEHIRPLDEVESVEFNIVISTAKKLIAPVRMHIEQVEKPPCGIEIECRNCPIFKAQRCLGCPAIGQYRGSFW